MKVRRLPKSIMLLIAAVGVLVVLGLFLVFVVVAVMDDDDYRALAVWGAERLGDVRMVIDGDFDVQWSRELAFSASGIRFEPLPDSRTPPLRAIGRIHIRIALAPLLQGILLVKDLEVDSLHFAQEASPPDDISPTFRWPWGFLFPVVERVALNDLQFLFGDQKEGGPHELFLQRLNVDDIDDKGPLILQGNGRLNAEAFRISGRTGGTLEFFQGQNPFPIDLAFTIADLQANLKGSIDHPVEGRGFNLKLTIEEQDLATLLRAFAFDVPSLGRLSFTAGLTGDIESLRLMGLDLEVDNGAGIQMVAKGSLPSLATGRGTEVAIDQAIKNRRLLDWLFPDDLKIVEEFRLSAALRHMDGQYTVTINDAWVANDKGIVFNCDGLLKLGSPFEDALLTAVDLNLNVVSPDTAAIKPLLTDAIPEIGGVQATARLVGPIDHLALEDMFIDRGGSGPVQVTNRGRIGRIPLAADEPLEEIDFTASIQAEDSEILREFYEIPLGELGRVDLTGRIVGSSRQFKLQEVILKTQSDEGLETHVTGGIDFVRHADGRVVGDLGFKVQWKSPTLSAGEPLLGLSIMPSLGPISGVADVSGTTEEMSIENILATGGHPDRLYAEWRGRVDSIPLETQSVSSGHETYGSIYAARSSDFAALFGITLPDVGPVRGSWRDVDRNGVLGMADIEVAVGDGKRFSLQAKGKIDNIIDQNIYETFEEERIQYFGVAFEFDLKTTDTDNIAKLIGISMPDLGPVVGSWQLTGNERRLAIRNARLKSTSATGLEIIAAGDISQIDLIPGGGIHELALGIEARAPDIRSLPGFTVEALPDLGPVEAAGRLTNRQNALDLEAVQIRTGPDTAPTLTIKGRLGDINNLQRARLEVDFETGARPWLEKALEREIRDNPRLAGSLVLGVSDDQIRIDRFQVTSQERGGLEAEGAGTVAMAGENRGIDVQLRTSTSDPPAWGRLLDISLPPLAPTQITGWYREKDSLHQFNGDVRLGASRFQADFHGTTRGNKPAIEATLAAQTLRLEDLGFYPQSATSANRPDDAPRAEPPTRLFDDRPLSLETLDDLDLSLKIMADEVISRETVFKNVGLDLVVKDGRLQIGPTTIKYLNGTTTIDAFVDANLSPPFMGLYLAVEDAQIEEILTSVDRPLVLGGQLTFFADLRSAGRSRHEIAANLHGETGFVIENGKIQRKIERLASDALDFLFTGPAGQSYTDLKCTAFRMLFEDGTGTIQVFFVETPGMRTEAFGEVNLADETIAVIINPRSKRRIIRRSSPVRIHGALQDPSIVKVPAEEAAILAGQVLIPIVALPARAIGVLWSLISRDDKVPDCFIAPDTGP
ncbi:MAG: AsmA family protein [Desulfobacterales bacterium]|nr:AsmA family protein [Desulfobacterales bacterium]